MHYTHILSSPPFYLSRAPGNYLFTPPCSQTHPSPYTISPTGRVGGAASTVRTFLRPARQQTTHYYDYRPVNAYYSCLCVRTACVYVQTLRPWRRRFWARVSIHTWNDDDKIDAQTLGPNMPCVSRRRTRQFLYPRCHLPPLLPPSLLTSSVWKCQRQWHERELCV